MSDKYLHAILLFIILVVSIWAGINPVHPVGWAIENVLVIIFVALLLITAKNFKFSNASYIMFTIFLVLHIIGSHYTYKEVPFGYTIGEWVGSPRNTYDRLVHLVFGLMFAYPIYEVLRRSAKASKFWASFGSFTAVSTAAVLYELIEWIWASSISKSTGDVFLGAQGDIWDAQKDMAIAMAGALFVLVIMWFYKRK